jgi:uncharacterized glyoxalase superfamily protein PhnB
VADVEATVAFYEKGFGLERRFVTPEGDYGELETGATTLSFVSLGLAGQNLDAAGGFAPIEPTGSPVGASITLITDDVTQAVATAEQAGATRYTEPTVKPWGQTVAYMRDPNGILLEVGTPVPA